MHTHSNFEEENTKENKTIFSTVQGRLRFLSVSFIVILLVYAIVVFTQSLRTNNSIQNSRLIMLKFKNTTEKIINATNQSATLQRTYFLTTSPIYREQNLLLWKNNLLPTVDTLLILVNKSKDKDLIKMTKEIIDYLKKYQRQQEKMYFHIETNLNTYLKITDTAQVERQEKSMAIKSYLKKGIEIITQQLEPYRKLIVEKSTLLSNKIQKNIQDSLELSQNALAVNIYFTIGITLIIILLTLTLSYYISHQLRKSISKIVHLLSFLSKGELPKKVDINRDEFDEIIKAVNQLSNNLRQASEFALQIGKGNFYTQFAPASNNDILGNSLLVMREQLRDAAQEDAKRTWVAQGLTKFSEIIRNNSDTLQELNEAFLSEIIDYINALQGAVFLVNTEKQHDNITILELMAMYALDRKKYLNKQIEIHGKYADTLVGQCYLEKDKIILKDIPANYSKISSGLGEHKPSYLLLIPIKINKVIEGVLELAFFEEIEEYKIEFIERICEVLASSIISVRSLNQTKFLLQELQTQTSLMKEQEEIMRKTMEELVSTQEIMKQKQTELEKLKQSLEIEVENRTKALQDALIRFDLLNQASTEGLWDMVVPEDGKINFDTTFHWSKQLVQSLGFTEEEFPNKFSSWALRVHPDDTENLFKSFINHFKDKSNQTPFKAVHRLQTKDKGYRWFEAGAKTLRNKEGKPIRVAGYINDVTHQKQLNELLLNLQQQKEELGEQKKELEKSNAKMKANEEVLRKTFEKMKAKEIETKKQAEELQQQTEQLKAQEEELKQNMEELVATQEEIIRKNKELESKNVRMLNSEAILKKELEKSKQILKEQEILKQTIKQLEQKIIDLESNHKNNF
jgi:PAS domain-containing protein/ABC-type glycerol-3-phosphate transport system permease component